MFTAALSDDNSYVNTSGLILCAPLSYGMHTIDGAIGMAGMCDTDSIGRCTQMLICVSVEYNAGSLSIISGLKRIGRK